MRSLINF